ncbi:MAG: hypothetical protein ACTSO3_08135 [Candidatus Heimdallarchaeaceae archaeon]
MSNKKLIRGIASILFIIVLISANTEASLLSNVGVNIGDSFEYKYNQIQLSLSHNGTTYVNYQGADIVGKTINITVDDFYETVDQSFIGFNYDRVEFNQTERFESMTNETHSYLDYWFDMYRIVELAFNSTIVNFDPEDYEFHPPNEEAVYDYNIVIGLPIFATTNISFYEDINENGFPEAGDSYSIKERGKEEITEEIKHSRVEQISFLENILNVNITNEDSLSGVTIAEEDWSIHCLTRYDLSINAEQGLVKKFLYEYSFDVALGSQHTESKTILSFEQLPIEVLSEDFSLAIPLLILSSVLVLIVLRRRKA